MKQLNVRLNEEVVQDLKIFCIKQDTQINTIVERAIEFYLACQKNYKDEDYTSESLDRINTELQYYLLNDTMSIELKEGATLEKIEAINRINI